MLKVFIDAWQEMHMVKQEVQMHLLRLYVSIKLYLQGVPTRTTEYVNKRSVLEEFCSLPEYQRNDIESCLVLFPIYGAMFSDLLILNPLQ